MSLFRTVRSWALVAAGAAFGSAGCASTARNAGSASSIEAPAVVRVGDGSVRPGASTAASVSSRNRTSIVPAAFEESLPVADSPSVSIDADPFAGQSELALESLVAAVQQRNPTLQASIAAWSAAAERHPQVVALEDPLLQSMLAPGSFPSSSNVQSSYYVGIAQKIPWYGKRALRGQVAQAEADATAHDSQDVRIRLEEVTRMAFIDYYLVQQDLELNTANTEALREFRDTANSKFEANQVSQQDVLQADVELGRLESRRIELEQNQRVAIARINTLLHRMPDHRLPPAAALSAIDEDLPLVESLRQLAIERRPDLTAKAARIQAEQAQWALACKEFYPDFEFMGRYDQFWTDVEQRPQVGMNVNIPLNQVRRKAAVREAMFRLSKLQAEYAQQVDAIRSDVHVAYARLEGAQKNARLYAETILPTSRQNVEAAKAGYIAAKVDFLRLVAAERELIELQEKQQEAIAESHRRRAELMRAVGSPIPMVGSGAATTTDASSLD